MKATWPKPAVRPAPLTPPMPVLSARNLFLHTPVFVMVTPLSIVIPLKALKVSVPMICDNEPPVTRSSVAPAPLLILTVPLLPIEN